MKAELDELPGQEQKMQKVKEMLLRWHPDKTSHHMTDIGLELTKNLNKYKADFNESASKRRRW